MTSVLPLEKSQLPNLGVPIFCDPETNLAAIPKATQDSWYMKFHFQAEGKEIGVVWHQHVTGTGAQDKGWFGEFILMNGTDGVWIPEVFDQPASDKIGASEEACHVFSSYGTLDGDSQRLKLKLAHDRGAVNLVLSPRREVLFNGTTGYLSLLTGSYQFAFPHMAVQGTVTLDGVTYEVPAGTTAWFDRQWSFTLAADGLSQSASGQLPSWLWIGTPLNEAGAAISLWDVFAGGTRRSFATILDDGGLQYNVVAEVDYENIWKSDRTGCSYPGKVRVRVPAVDLALTFEAMMEDPTYDHGEGAINGGMSLSTMRGTYRGEPIDSHYILEMVGDLCG